MGGGSRHSAVYYWLRSNEVGGTSWKSKRQSILAVSSAEAEVVAASAMDVSTTVQEVMYPRIPTVGPLRATLAAGTFAQVRSLESTSRVTPMRLVFAVSSSFHSSESSFCSLYEYRSQ